MKLTDILDDRGVDALALKKHLLWACKTLRNTPLPPESTKEVEFKKEGIIQNTELLIHIIEEDLQPPMTTDDFFSTMN